MPKKLSQEEFIAKSIAVHGVGRYDYSQVVFVNTYTKIIIVCPEHGAFKQAPGPHISQAQGCPRCGDLLKNKARTLTVDQFIINARLLHGESYDYSLVEYRSNSHKVKLRCIKHGVFMQTPNNHISKKHICPKCSREALGSKIALTPEEWIAKARIVHGDKYDYSATFYARSWDKVIIICCNHGEFEQVANDHLSGYGCRRCAIDANTVRHTHTLAEFIEKARLVHGEKYDYSQVEYRRGHLKVKIICPIHGVFEQTPFVHNLQGAGCSLCGRERTNAGARLEWIDKAAGRAANLYLLRLFTEQEEFYKVGITYQALNKRFSPCDLAGYKFETIALYTSQSASAVFDWEQSIIETFAHLKYKPKQSFGGETECFSSCDEILAIFPVAG